jgi:hypothetical protein
VGRPDSGVLRVVGLVFLCGCAATTQSGSSAAPREPDCSFRSATTCWTLGSRFPSPRAAQPDSARKELLEQPPTILATEADTIRSSR